MEKIWDIVIQIDENLVGIFLKLVIEHMHISHDVPDLGKYTKQLLTARIVSLRSWYLIEVALYQGACDLCKRSINARIIL